MEKLTYLQHTCTCYVFKYDFLHICCFSPMTLDFISHLESHKGQQHNIRKIYITHNVLADNGDRSRGW